MKVKQILLLMLSVSPLLSCSPHFVKIHYLHGVVREDIDTVAFRKFVKKNIASSNTYHTYEIIKGERVISFAGQSNGSYNISIGNKKSKETFGVAQKDGRIINISRQVHKSISPSVNSFYSYYPNGTLRDKITRMNFYYGKGSTGYFSTNIGLHSSFDEKGQLFRIIDYDKCFPISMFDVIKIYEGNLKEDIWLVSQIYIDEKHTSAGEMEELKKAEHLFSYKHNHPYYLINSFKYNENSRFYSRVIDGITGEILSMSSTNITHHSD